MKTIPYSTQNINKSDLNIVNSALKKELLTGGNYVKIFENKINKFIGSKFSVVMNSATSCLLAACNALRLKKKDKVWVVSNSFVSTANCAAFFGADIEFLDIDKNTYNVDVEKLKNKLENTNKKNLPKILIIVHLGGNPCDLEEIYKLKKKYKFKIIEDASHAFGAEYKNKKIGSFSNSEITIFSFHPVKIITTAEGGCCTTNSKNLFNRLQLFRDNGLIRNPKKKKKYFYNNYYEMRELGLNLRLNDIQCALGISQLSRIKKNLNFRRNIANYYFKKLGKLRLRLPIIKKGFLSSYHLFIIQFVDANKKNYKLIINYFKKNKISVNTHYFPIHLQPYYQKNKKFNLPESLNYYFKSFSIPMYYGLSKKKQDKVINVITRLIESNIFKKKKIIIKKAEYKDSKFIFSLQNKDENRKYFFNDKQIELKEHQLWYKTKMSDKYSFLYCVYNQNSKCGFIHLNKIGKKSLEISIIIDKKFRKKGIAYDALNQIINKKFLSGYKIYASSKNNNYSSIRLFESLGFIFRKETKEFIFLKKIVN